MGTRTRQVRVHTKVHFYKPKTLILSREPKYVRSLPRTIPKEDKYNVIKSPHNSEASMKKIEDHNTLVFLVNTKSNKRQIKAAVKELYGVDAVRINTLVRPDGQKKAYVRLAADSDALDVANKIGLI